MKSQDYVTLYTVPAGRYLTLTDISMPTCYYYWPPYTGNVVYPDPSPCSFGEYKNGAFTVRIDALRFEYGTMDAMGQISSISYHSVLGMVFSPGSEVRLFNPNPVTDPSGVSVPPAHVVWNMTGYLSP